MAYVFYNELSDRLIIVFKHWSSEFYEYDEWNEGEKYHVVFSEKSPEDLNLFYIGEYD